MQSAQVPTPCLQWVTLAESDQNDRYLANEVSVLVSIPSRGLNTSRAVRCDVARVTLGTSDPPQPIDAGIADDDNDYFQFKDYSMKIIRFQDSSGAAHYGCQHENGNTTILSGDIYGEYSDTGTTADVAKLLAPIVPVDILCIGLNYAKHAEEANLPMPEFPVLFMKNIGALQNPGDPIVIPQTLKCETVDYECELAVVIGKKCLNVSQKNALDHVLGYTCAHDVSERHWQKHGGGGQWCRGKTFATFCPLGPCLVTTDEITDPNTLGIKTTLNGQVMQDWNTNDMIFSVPRLIEFLSASTILLPGTVILTGTPQGIGAARQPPVYLKSGDTCTISIERIGDLTNPVVAEGA